MIIFHFIFPEESLDLHLSFLSRLILIRFVIKNTGMQNKFREISKKTKNWNVNR